MSDCFRLEGQHILVTGASGGIGRAIAILASEMGAKVALVGRDENRLQTSLNIMNGEGHSIHIKDLSEQDSLSKWLQEVTITHGALHGLVHAAGIQTIRPLKILDEKTFRETLSLNLESAISLTRGFRHKKVSGAGGSVVFISSVMALTGQAGQVAYCASKGGLVSASKALALELAREKIRVNCVAPGLVQTEMADRLGESISSAQFDSVKAMHPLGLGEPEDVAAAVVYLLSNGARWVTGSTLVIDGGYMAH